MKKFYLIFTALAALFAFSSCTWEEVDHSRASGYTFVYNIDSLYKDNVEFFYNEISSSTCKYAGKLEGVRGVYYYSKSRENVFDETLVVLDFDLPGGFMPSSKDISISEWTGLKEILKSDTRFEFSSEDSQKIFAECEKAYNNEILIFVQDSSDDAYYNVLYLRMSKKR